MAFRMRWPTRQGTIRQRFGEHPAIYGKFGLPGHEGVDLDAPYASEVFAVANGFVSDVRLDGFAKWLTNLFPVPFYLPDLYRV